MPSKSCKLDTIPTTLLKKVVKHCLPSITKVANLLLDTGAFCKRLKCTVVWPLIKAISKGTVKTIYRHSQQPTIYLQIIEKCTINQLTTHCDMYNLLLEYQSACRKFYSCKTSLLKVVSDTVWAMEQQPITAVLIMDLLAVFDTVNHDLFGITNTVLKWYKNFLKPRKFKICINTSYSSEWIMDFCPSQRITQGAYLFICYASTLSQIVPDSIILISFADDPSIKRTFKQEKRNTNKDNKASSGDDTIMIMERSMQDIKAWMEAVKLKLNEPKTEFIYSRRRQQLYKSSKHSKHKKRIN